MYVYDAAGTTQPGVLYQESHVATGAFAFPGFRNLVSTKEITANFEATAVPEPSTAVFGAIGLLGLVFRRRRIRNQPR